MEKTIEELMEEIFAENPKITKEDMKTRLQTEKDSIRINKPRWKSDTIRNRINAFYKDKEPKIKFAQSEESSKIEGMDIKKHPDIFKSSDEVTIVRGERLNSDSDHLAGVEGDAIDKQIIDTGIAEDIKSFKKELISIVKDFKKEVDKNIAVIEQTVNSLVQELPNIRQGFNIPEPEKEYLMLELEKSLVEEIKKICDERNIDEESDYIQTLLKHEEEFLKYEVEYPKLMNSIEAMTKGFDKYNNLVVAVIESGGKGVFKIDFDDKTGQLGIVKSSAISFRTKMLIIIGVIAALLTGIGAGIGLASYLKLVHIVLLPF